MKRVLILILIGAALGGGGVWLKMRGAPKPAADEKPAADKPAADAASEETHITHDTNGNVVVNMTDETRGDAGIEVGNPTAAKFSPELKGYGRVQDPAALASLVQEWMNAKIALDYSSQELERMKVLLAQKNTSDRAFKTAEETFLHDRAAADAVMLKAKTSWGSKFAGRIASYIAANEAARKEDPLVGSIIEMKSLLVRIDLPAGEALKSTDEIAGARIVPLAGNAAPLDATFVDAAPGMDPQSQMQSLYFLVTGDHPGLLPGAALTGYLKLAGDPVTGVVIPRDAVVRKEGKGWVYVMNGGGEAFTRIVIALDHPAEGGWFVTNGLTANDHIVTTGAQTLLSEELKAALSGD